ALVFGQEVEILNLTGKDDINGFGNNFANTITGNAGKNNLDGFGGNDTLNGGKGNDSYTVDDAKDKLTEAAGQGIDTVWLKVASFTLGANFEQMVLTS